MEAKHVIGDKGRHTIRVVCDLGIFQGQESCYEHPAILKIEKRTFIAFTQYWDGFLPCEKVLELKEVQP